jgi:hypothetical protein
LEQKQAGSGEGSDQAANDESLGKETCQEERIKLKYKKLNLLLLLQ